MKKITFNGKTQNVTAWAAQLSISHNTLCKRLINRPLRIALSKNFTSLIQRTVTFRGETKTHVEWAAVIGITPAAFTNRLKRMSVEKAITTPRSSTQPKKHKQSKYLVDGQLLTVADLARKLETNTATIYQRIKRFNGDIHEVLNRPVLKRTHYEHYELNDREMVLFLRNLSNCTQTGLCKKLKMSDKLIESWQTRGIPQTVKNVINYIIKYRHLIEKSLKMSQ